PKSEISNPKSGRPRHLQRHHPLVELFAGEVAELERYDTDGQRNRPVRPSLPGMPMRSVVRIVRRGNSRPCSRPFRTLKTQNGKTSTDGQKHRRETTGRHGSPEPASS